MAKHTVRGRSVAVSAYRPVFQPARQAGNLNPNTAYAVSYPDTTNILAGLRGGDHTSILPGHRSGVSFGEAMAF